MPSDPSKPLLRLAPDRERERSKGRSRPVPKPEPFPRERQIGEFSPKFARLAEVLARDASGIELRTDPSDLAPERLLVLEVRGSISAFADAARRVGIDLVDEEELQADEDDKAPVAYLMMPDARALENLESLWRRWESGQLERGLTPWRDVFDRLRAIRSWGPSDRVQPDDADTFAEETEGLPPEAPVRLEIELVYTSNLDTAANWERRVTAFVQEYLGSVLRRCRLEDIGYHALLAEMPAEFVRSVSNPPVGWSSSLDLVRYIRPQSSVDAVEIADPADGAPIGRLPTLGDPIVGLLDGVPISAHPLLAAHTIVDDPFDLVPGALVADRIHGTAMASLIIHGDKNGGGSALPRRIHVVPVMGARDEFPQAHLVVDLIYRAVRRMREGPEATAPNVLIVNLSLGNKRRRFYGQLSPWARLLDRLAHQYGILFLVSAGNCREQFPIRAFSTRTAFEDADPGLRARETLRALAAIVADRRVFSPAETVNGITVGACNEDFVAEKDRAAARSVIDPYSPLMIANPSSALGPGFATSVKPDILMSGARERLRIVRNHSCIEVEPAGATRAAGLRVAAPLRDGKEGGEAYTGGTSAAAALASRTCHRIHDALEAAYGASFTGLPHIERAVLLKALLVHPAKWPEATAEMIKEILGPPDNSQHVKQKDNIRRLLGFGCVDPETAIACASDRATFWATGYLGPETAVDVAVPVPAGISGRPQPHRLAATLAWFTPTSPGRKAYRTVRLKILEPTWLGQLGLDSYGKQPDINQTGRGTLFSRCWVGDRAAAVSENESVALTIQREIDQGAVIDEKVPFGLAVTIEMPGVLTIYDQVRQRIGPRLRVS